MPSSLLLALPHELSLDILIDWVAEDKDSELSSLDIAHTSHADRPAFLALLKQTVLDHDHHESSRSNYSNQIAWLLSRQIKPRRDFIWTDQLVHVTALLSPGCFPRLTHLTLEDNEHDDDVEGCLFSAEDLQALLSACPNLQHLSLQCVIIGEPQTEVLCQCGMPLTGFAFHPLQSMRDEEVEQIQLHRVILAFAASLQVLNVGNTVPINGDCFKAIGACTQLTTVSVPCTMALADAFLEAYASLPNLTKLTVCDLDGDSPEEDGLDDPAFVKIANTCSRLSELYATFSKSVRPRACLQALRSCPWLQALFTPYWTYNRRHAEENFELVELLMRYHSEFDMVDLLELLAHAPTDIDVTSLDLLQSYDMDHRDLAVIGTRFGHCLLALKLNVADAERTGPRPGPQQTQNQCLSHLLSQCPLLQKLSLHGSYKITKEVMFVIAYICSNLLHLTLHRCALLRDEDVEYLTSKLKPLRSIALHNIHHLTEHSIRSIGSHCRQLTTLALSGDGRSIDWETAFAPFHHPIDLKVSNSWKPTMKTVFSKLRASGEEWLRRTSFSYE